MNNIAIRCDHCSFIGEIQGNRLSVIPLLKKGCGCGGEFHDDDCKCSCTDYRRDPLCTMHTEGATTQPTPASEQITHEWLGTEEVNDWFVASCSCGWTYQHPNYGTTQETFVNHWGDHILDARSKIPFRGEFQHDDDCPCYDEQHSIDCKNCECQWPKCNVPPAGWTCSRKRGHDGPCAATPVAQPVPSAGSKPQEEDFDPLVCAHGVFLRSVCGECEDESDEASLPDQSDPVADGGGLPLLDDIQIILNLRQQVLFLESGLASSQEALRVAREELAASKRYGVVEYRLEQTLRQERDTAETELTDLRERMQQAVTHLEEALGEYHDTVQIKAAISLLSPEGSSR